ncbi:MAG: hypothetical protein P3C10_09680 [Gemmatimonadota bacterium]|nr:hypothetical protein [Gemmatimonadota bacterium]
MSTIDSTARRSAEVPVMVAPYASPLSTSARSARDGMGVTVQMAPYIPAPWRGRPSLERAVAPVPLDGAGEETRTVAAGAWSAPEVEAATPAAPRVAPAMPWIDAFLAATPALPMRAIEPPPFPEREIAPSFLAAMADTGFAEAPAPRLATPFAVPALESPTDDWALGDAAQELEALAHDFNQRGAAMRRALESDGLFESAVAPEFLPAWSDDDLIDIMPWSSARTSGPSPTVAPNSFGDSGAPEIAAPSADIEPWADRARRTGTDGAEAAARALELLARRVRDGELSLTGYEPRLGDAAVLAAALAALLGVRPS